MIQVASEMQARAKRTSWNTLCWAPTDNGTGGVTPGEGVLLYGLVRSLRPRNLLEWGTGYGHGTLHIAQACQDNGAGHLWTFEIGAVQAAEAGQNIAAAGLSGIVTQCVPPPAGLPQIDFAFIDAGHTLKDVEEYMDSFTLSPGGVIVIHDADYQHNAQQIAAIWGMPIVVLPTDSAAGLAILGGVL